MSFNSKFGIKAFNQTYRPNYSNYKDNISLAIYIFVENR